MASLFRSPPIPSSTWPLLSLPRLDASGSAALGSRCPRCVYLGLRVRVCRSDTVTIVKGALTLTHIVQVILGCMT